MLLVIDNYDSFTYNLVQCLGALGAEPLVRRNDAVSLDEIAGLAPQRIVISPGPGRPEDAGVTVELIRRFAPSVPLLGVCLGHQALGQAFGGRVLQAPTLRHGKRSPIEHDGCGVFAGLEQGFDAGRYHSLCISEEGWPEALELAARAGDDGTVMGMRHREFPAHGVQFHPESVLTPAGERMLRNFLEL